MRPNYFEKALAPVACVLVSCVLLSGTQAQAPTAMQPPNNNFPSHSLSSNNTPTGNSAASNTSSRNGNIASGNAAPATTGLPAEMWRGNPASQPANQHPPIDGAAFRSQPSNTSLPELRPSLPARVGNGNSVGSGTATQLIDNSNAAVVPASHLSTGLSSNHETQRPATRTPLPPKSKADDVTKPKAGGSTLQMFVSLGSSLAIVIGLFLGVAVLYRKSLSANLGRGLPKNVLQVLGKTTVAPRQQMLLLRFGSKLVLVSMIQGEARTISEITDPLEVDQLAGLCEGNSTGSATNSFREILTQGAKA